MKTYAALLFAVSAGLSLSAAAEPFNDRSQYYSANPQITDRGGAPVAVAATGGGFNDRGENYIITAPAGSNKPFARVAAQGGGFNDRSPGYIHETGRTAERRFSYNR